MGTPQDRSYRLHSMSTPITRRMLLKSFVGAAGLGLLAACGGSDSDPTPTTSSGAATTAPETTTAATADATATSSSGAASTPAGSAATEAATEAAASTEFAGQEMIINGYGAEWQEIFTNVLQKPFEERYGVTVTLDSSGSAAEDYAKIRATQGDPGWDLVVATAQEPGQGAKEGLLLPITEAEVPNMANVYPALREMVGEYGAPQEIQFMSLMYNKEQIDPPPDSWSIFWDEQYAGRILLFDPANIIGVFFLFMAAKLNGGDMENLDPGWDALAELKGRTLAMPTSSAEAVPYMQTGDVWLMPYWDGRASVYKKEGLPYDFLVPSEGSVALVNSLIIPKGAENPELAYEFINFWLEPEVQREWSLGYNVGPTQPGIELPEDFQQEHVASTEDLEQLLQPDYEYISQNRPQWTEQWRRIFSG